MSASAVARRNLGGIAGATECMWTARLWRATREVLVAEEGRSRARPVKGRRRRRLEGRTGLARGSQTGRRKTIRVATGGRRRGGRRDGGAEWGRSAKEPQGARSAGRQIGQGWRALEHKGFEPRPPCRARIHAHCSLLRRDVAHLLAALIPLHINHPRRSRARPLASLSPSFVCLAFLPHHPTFPFRTPSFHPRAPPESKQLACDRLRSS